MPQITYSQIKYLTRYTVSAKTSFDVFLRLMIQSHIAVTAKIRTHGSMRAIQSNNTAKIPEDRHTIPEYMRTAHAHYLPIASA
jgi:hypothetical protein